MCCVVCQECGPIPWAGQTEGSQMDQHHWPMGPHLVKEEQQGVSWWRDDKHINSSLACHKIILKSRIALFFSLSRQAKLFAVKMAYRDSYWVLMSLQVKLQCQKGIPASLRAKCWPLLCGASERMRQNENLYEARAKMFSLELMVSSKQCFGGGGFRKSCIVVARIWLIFMLNNLWEAENNFLIIVI